MPNQNQYMEAFSIIQGSMLTAQADSYEQLLCFFHACQTSHVKHDLMASDPLGLKKCGTGKYLYLPHRSFFIWTHPPRISINPQTFPYIIGCWDHPLASKFSDDLPWGGYGYFLEPHPVGLKFLPVKTRGPPCALYLRSASGCTCPHIQNLWHIR